MQFSSSCLDSFLSYCDGPPRDLHSFPTRRSSDLRGAKIQTIRSPGFDDFLIQIGSVNNSSPHDVAVWDENATRSKKALPHIDDGWNMLLIPRQHATQVRDYDVRSFRERDVARKFLGKLDSIVDAIQRRV